MGIRILFIFTFLTSLLSAQEYENVKIGSRKHTEGRLCEPAIAVNKKDPNKILAAAILDQYFYSEDSGHTWTQDTLRSSYGVWGDPVLVSDKDGAFYYLHLSDPTGENWKSEEILDRIVCQRSDDGGKTWNDGGYMGLDHPKDQDKQWAITDPNNGAIYSTWTQFDKYGSADSIHRSNIMFSKSTNGGEDWSQAIIISEKSGGCIDDDNTTEGAVPAVSRNGEIYVSWSNHGQIYFDRSLDGGITWLEEDKIVAEHHGGWEILIPGLNRANGMPVTVCDISDGPNQGTIYVNWVDDREGNYDVWVSKSTDKGDTWSTPKKVNDDEDGTKDQFFTWISCDPITGNLFCIFYDRRNHKKTKTDVYMAVSEDGGHNWKNIKISEKSFKPNPFVFFGDYNNIDAFNGVVRPIWTHYTKKEMSIWTAIINYK